MSTAGERSAESPLVPVHWSTRLVYFHTATVLRAFSAACWRQSQELANGTLRSFAATGHFLFPVPLGYTCTSTLIPCALWAGVPFCMKG